MRRSRVKGNAASPSTTLRVAPSSRGAVRSGAGRVARTALLLRSTTVPPRNAKAEADLQPTEAKRHHEVSVDERNEQGDDAEPDEAQAHERDRANGERAG